MAKNQNKARASTQEHLDIEDIIDDLVILKTGWVALVMLTTAVNFDLFSEAEQDATIYAFGAFLNSLSFPLQILIRSKKADITSYFQSLEEAEATQPNPDLKRQIQKYKDFIQSTVQQKTVLDKKFYLILDFSPLELGLKGLRKTNPTQSKNKAQLLSEAKAALIPKRDHVIKQTARLGITTRQLTAQELIELFYDIYNPAPTGTQRVLLDTAAYTTPLVQPALEVPTSQEEVARNLPQVSHNIQPQVVAPMPTQAPAAGLDLRAVPPQQQTISTNLPNSQTTALKNLQSATAVASQILNSQTSPATTIPQQPAPQPQNSMTQAGLINSNIKT